MAKPTKKKVAKVEWKGYHKINLSPSDELQFETWADLNPIQFTDLEVIANNGYKFALSWDDYHEGYSASLYCQNSKLSFCGYTLSAWAADVDTAVKLLFFKHFVMAKEEWELVTERADKNLSKYG